MEVIAKEHNLQLDTSLAYYKWQSFLTATFELNWFVFLNFKLFMWISTAVLQVEMYE